MLRIIMKLICCTYIIAYGFELSAGRLENTAATLCRNLNNTLIPMWTSPKLIDPDGGFANRKVITPALKKQPHKALIGQLRELYLYSLACKRSRKQAEQKRLRKIIDRALKYLHRTYWTPENGWKPCNVSLKIAPRTLESIHALYMFSWIHLLTSSPLARKLAGQTYDFIMKAAWDSEFGGFNKMPYANNSKDRNKNIGFNIHGLAALDKYNRINLSPTFKEHCCKCLMLIYKHFMYPETGYFYDELAKDYSPLPGSNRQKILFGYSIEAVWYTLAVAENQKLMPSGFQVWLEKYFELCGYVNKYMIAKNTKLYQELPDCRQPLQPVPGKDHWRGGMHTARMITENLKEIKWIKHKQF